MTQYRQTELHIDLMQGNTNSLPTWMKTMSDRALIKTPPLKATQILLFDTSTYVEKPPYSKTEAPNAAVYHKQATVLSS